MPFTIKDVLQYKLNHRQQREIHEREYVKYIENLRQKQQQPNARYTSDYYLPVKYVDEVERTRARNASIRQHLYTNICHENLLITQRLIKASKRTVVDDKNENYQKNLNMFTTKRNQQRSHEYNRIYDDNQILLQRINNVRGRLISKQQCENEWRKHVEFMKKSCCYPENIDKFVIRGNKCEQKQECPYSVMSTKQKNKRHSLHEPSTQISMKPLTILLNES